MSNVEGVTCERCSELLTEQGDYYYKIPYIYTNAPGGPYAVDIYLCEECYEKWENEHRWYTW